ncbi:helix-turn-helix domain-containing protein [Microbacterium rhizophilus]|uniref:helix-turn-helix domain-containing protein n=1 Tax=Microbacterium rhizophilus TaxID=3138934 RepID=UPI0031E90A2F
MSATATKRPPLLTPDDIAERWKVRRKYVLELARKKDLASIKVGRYTRFEQAAVERYERAHREEAD